MKLFEIAKQPQEVELILDPTHHEYKMRKVKKSEKLKEAKREKVWDAVKSGKQKKHNAQAKMEKKKLPQSAGLDNGVTDYDVNDPVLGMSQ